METLYEKKTCEYGYDLVQVTTTGKWKLVTDPSQDNVMYVEVKGWIFNHWVHEDNLIFSVACTEQIFTCPKKET